MTQWQQQQAAAPAGQPQPADPVRRQAERELDAFVASLRYLTTDERIHAGRLAMDVVRLAEAVAMMLQGDEGVNGAAVRDAALAIALKRCDVQSRLGGAVCTCPLCAAERRLARSWRARAAARWASVRRRIMGLKGRRHFGFKRPGGGQGNGGGGQAANDLRLPFQGGERVAIDLSVVEASDPKTAASLVGRDLTDAVVAGVTLGPKVVVKLVDLTTHWLPLAAVRPEKPSPGGGTQQQQSS